MDKPKIIIALIALNLCFAASALFFFLDNGSLREQFAALNQERDDALAKLTIADKDRQLLQTRLNASAQASEEADEESNEKLLKLLEQKDRDIVALKDALASADRQVAAQANAQQNDRRRPTRNDNERRGNMQDRMERMRAENPERYEQMIAWRENARKQAEERQQKRDEFLDKINTARLSNSQRDAINDYRALLQANQELAANAMAGDQESGREMWANQRAINELSNSVRDILIEQTAGSKTASEIKTILDITSAGGFGGGLGGGRSGGPGGGPGGGRGRR